MALPTTTLQLHTNILQPLTRHSYQTKNWSMEDPLGPRKQINLSFLSLPVIQMMTINYNIYYEIIKKLTVILVKY